MFTTTLSSQKYNMAGGINFNKYLGLTFKQRVAKHTTVEGILARTKTEKNYIGSILGVQHFPLLTKRLNFFVGGGPHFTKYEFKEDQFDTVLGLTAYTGLDFTIRDLNIAWDMQFRHNKYQTFSILEPATSISIRYVFVKRRSKLGKWFKSGKYKFWKKKK